MPVPFNLDDALTLVHLWAFSQVGTVARIYISKLFGGSCNPDYVSRWSWTPCVTSPGLERLGGAFFEDLPANVIGSFSMGLLSSSATLAAAYPGSGAGKHGLVALAMLPAGLSLQGHSALHVGLRTGFCGSFTTFASWMLQIVQMMIGGKPSVLGPEWVAALWGMYTNVAMSMAALVIGQHLALALHTRVFNPPASSRATSPAASPAGPPHITVSVDGVKAPQPLAGDSGDLGDLGDTMGKATEDCQGHAGQDLPASAPASGQELPLTAAAVLTPRPAAAAAVGRPALCWAVDGLAVVIMLFLTSISIGYAVMEGSSHESQVNSEGIWSIWISILMGPVGCLLRWRLSKLNGSFGWFPLGTFAANMLACTSDYAMQVILERVSLTLLQAAIIDGVKDGMNGSLSTVSTWVVEIQTLNLGMSAHFRGYTYAMASMVTATVLGIIIYGTGIWTIYD